MNVRKVTLATLLIGLTGCQTSSTPAMGIGVPLEHLPIPQGEEIPVQPVVQGVDL